jgi:hypothetical protein
MKKSLLIASLCLLILAPSALAQTKDIMIPAAAFRPGADHATYHIVNGYARLDTGSPYNFMTAPVNLPEDAKIVKMTIFFKDNGTGYLRVFLYRMNLYTGDWTTHFDIETTGDTSAIRSQSDSSGYLRIKNGGYQTWLRLYFSDTTIGTSYHLYGVKLTYNE